MREEDQRFSLFPDTLELKEKQLPNFGLNWASKLLEKTNERLDGGIAGPDIETILSSEGAGLYEGPELMSNLTPDGPVEAHVLLEEDVLGLQVVRSVSGRSHLCRRTCGTSARGLSSSPAREAGEEVGLAGADVGPDPLEDGGGVGVGLVLKLLGHSLAVDPVLVAEGDGREEELQHEKYYMEEV